MNFTEIRDQILVKLSDLEREYQQNKGIILTESDMHCLLFRKIYDLFDHSQNTFDTFIQGSPLHSEITFFNEKGKLFYKPDITIIKPDNYSIIHSISDVIIKDEEIFYKPTASKMFSFGGDAIIIELKFCRGEKGISKIRPYQEDLRKIKKIKKLVEQNSSSRMYGIIAIFNKTDKKSGEFEHFLGKNYSKNDIHVRYYTGKVEV
ncbi:MAG: hypothetical protein PWP52_1014 [Bacteroidales bacterium]|nr:hypothetical protein [Bacteroidales bacterium]